MRIVAAEEHFSSTAFDGQLPAHHPGFEWPVSQLRDIGAGRIADMNKHGISTQVIVSKTQSACAIADGISGTISDGLRRERY